jgi:hypothetical protein
MQLSPRQGLQENRADETARQGNTIMFFTIVTIIFGSTSFVTAFFALNITTFPKDKDGTTTWNLGHIVGIVAGVSIGLALPFVLVAFMINPIKEFSDKRRRLDYKSSAAYWTSLLTNIITLRFISNMLWWQKFRATSHPRFAHREPPASLSSTKSFSYDGAWFTPVAHTATMRKGSKPSWIWAYGEELRDTRGRNHWRYPKVGEKLDDLPTVAQYALDLLYLAR